MFCLILICIVLACLSFHFKYTSKQNAIKSLPLPRTLTMMIYPSDNTQCPKIVHRSFRSRAESKRLFKNAWRCTEEGLRGEGWEQRFYSDRDVDRWITKHFGGSRIATAYNLINPAYGASRADYFRYLLLFVEGGLWLDSKSCAVSPPPPFEEGGEIMISPWRHIIWSNIYLFGLRGEFQNWYIYSKPRSKPLWSVIERVTQNIFDVQEKPNAAACTKLADASTKAKALVLGVTGPAAYTIAMDAWMKKNIPGIQITKPNLNGCVRYSVVKHHEKVDTKHYSRAKDLPYILQ